MICLRVDLAATTATTNNQIVYSTAPGHNKVSTGGKCMNPVNNAAGFIAAHRTASGNHACFNALDLGDTGPSYTADFGNRHQATSTKTGDGWKSILSA